MRRNASLVAMVLCITGLAGSVFAQGDAKQWGEVEEGIWLKPNAQGVPTLYDTHTGMMMFEDENGRLISKSYRDGGKGSGKQAGGTKSGAKASANRKETRGKAAGKKTEAEQKSRVDPAMFWDARALLYREMLECTDDEWKLVILPLLKAVLIKQDEIRRSTMAPSRLQTAARASWGGRSNTRSGDLPSAIRAFHGRLRQQGNLEVEDLKRGLTDFRSARRKQDVELKDRRDKLRAVLAVLQEARLTAVGVLD